MDTKAQKNRDCRLTVRLQRESRSYGQTLSVGYLQLPQRRLTASVSQAVRIYGMCWFSLPARFKCLVASVSAQKL